MASGIYDTVVQFWLLSISGASKHEGHPLIVLELKLQYGAGSKCEFTNAVVLFNIVQDAFQLE